MAKICKKQRMTFFLMALLLLALAVTAQASFSEWENFMKRDVTFSKYSVAVGETVICTVSDEIAGKAPGIFWLMTPEGGQEVEVPGTLSGNTASYTPNQKGSLSIKLDYGGFQQIVGAVRVGDSGGGDDFTWPDFPGLMDSVDISIDRDSALVGLPVTARLDFKGKTPDVIKSTWYFSESFNEKAVVVETQEGSTTPSYTPQKAGNLYLQVEGSFTDGKPFHGVSKSLQISYQVSPIMLDVVFDQEDAVAGVPLKAQVMIDAEVPPASIVSVWKYGVQPEEITTEVKVQENTKDLEIIPEKPGHLSLEVTATDHNGSTTSLIRKKRILYKVSPVTIDIKLNTLDGKEGKAVTATWTVNAEIMPKDITYKWTLTQNEIYEKYPAIVNGNQSSHVPTMGGWLRFVIDAKDLNGRPLFFSSESALIAGKWKGPKPVLTDKMLQDKVKEIAAQCNAAAGSAYAKAKWMNEYIVKNVRYDFTFTHSTPHALLLMNTGICHSYSKAYQMLLNAVGVQSKYVSGSVDRGAHAWNLVKIGQYWYHVDTTWNEGAGNQWFLKSDESMRKDHKWNAASYPAAPYDYGKEPTASKLRGDADGNGKLEAADLVCVIEFLVSGTPSQTLHNADLNGDGRLGIEDLGLLFALIQQK